MLANSDGVVLPSVGKILCCICGIPMIPNAVAICEKCLPLQADFQAFSSQITQDIKQCPKCERWQVGHSENSWIHHDLESNSLLTACMKKIPGLSHNHEVKILDASWIWTEPHSKRLKFHVDLEKLVLSDRFPIRQRILCTFTIKHSQCLECIHENSDHTWGAMVQFRHFPFGSKKLSNIRDSGVTVSATANNKKKKGHSKQATVAIAGKNKHDHHATSTAVSGQATMAYVESLLHKAKLAEHMINIEALDGNTANLNAANGSSHQKEGFNFYFKHRKYALKVCQFLSGQLPCYPMKVSRKLVSAQQHTHTARYEDVCYLEMIGYQKYDLLLLPKHLAGQQQLTSATVSADTVGNSAKKAAKSVSIAANTVPLVYIKKLTSTVHVINPYTGTRQTLSMRQCCGDVDSSSQAAAGIVDGSTSAASAGNLAGGSSGSSAANNAATPVYLFSAAQLTLYMILDIVQPDHTAGGSHLQQQSQGHVLEVTVAREKDLGENDQVYETRVYLPASKAGNAAAGGLSVEVGDYLWGYDLAHLQYTLTMEQEMALKAWYHVEIAPPPKNSLDDLLDKAVAVADDQGEEESKQQKGNKKKTSSKESSSKKKSASNKDSNHGNNKGEVANNNNSNGSSKKSKWLPDVIIVAKAAVVTTHQLPSNKKKDSNNSNRDGEDMKKKNERKQKKPAPWMTKQLAALQDEQQHYHLQQEQQRQEGQNGIVNVKLKKATGATARQTATGKADKSTADEEQQYGEEEEDERGEEEEGSNSSSDEQIADNASFEIIEDDEEEDGENEEGDGGDVDSADFANLTIDGEEGEGMDEEGGVEWTMDKDKLDDIIVEEVEQEEDNRVQRKI